MKEQEETPQSDTHKHNSIEILNRISPNQVHQKMPSITIHNKSGKNQEFECHGYNNNKNITVGGGKRVSFDAPDHTSGAIIALHDGHEGEQAEITKCGWQGQSSLQSLVSGRASIAVAFAAGGAALSLDQICSHDQGTTPSMSA